MTWRDDSGYDGVRELRFEAEVRYVIDADGRVWEAPEQHVRRLRVLAEVPIRRGIALLSQVDMWDDTDSENAQANATAEGGNEGGEVNAENAQAQPQRRPLKHPHVGVGGAFCPGDRTRCPADEAEETLKRLLSTVNLSSLMSRPYEYEPFFFPSTSGFRLISRPWSLRFCTFCDQPTPMQCQRCSTDVCEDCMRYCPECGDDVCRSCWSEEDEMCWSCRPVPECVECGRSTYGTCRDCGEPLCDDCAYVTANGHVCSQCFNRYYDCSYCRSFVLTDELIRVLNDAGDTEYYCARCLRRLEWVGQVARCDSCRRLTRVTDVTSEERVVCVECREREEDEHTTPEACPEHPNQDRLWVAQGTWTVDTSSSE